MGHAIGQPMGQPMALPITVGMPQPKPKPKYVVTSGLWLLVVETLIFIIISQRAREMMIKTRRNR